MSVLHLEIPRHSRVCDYFFMRVGLGSFDLVTVEHWVGCDVLERWLKLTSDHDVLLDELHVTFRFLRRCQLLVWADRDRIIARRLKWCFRSPTRCVVIIDRLSRSIIGYDIWSRWSQWRQVRLWLVIVHPERLVLHVWRMWHLLHKSLL